ncbi:hypothetical protein D3C87_1489100 [compost metagenome]|jgi:hypothetical protein
MVAAETVVAVATYPKAAAVSRIAISKRREGMLFLKSVFAAALTRKGMSVQAFSRFWQFTGEI